MPTDVVQALTRIEDPAQLDDLVAVFANGDAQTIAARLGSARCVLIVEQLPTG